MSRSALFAIDLVAIAITVFGLYFPRHRRRDMVVAYLVVNVGVLAVANALAATGLNAGLGLGLFGVLSIIRLRSAELDQPEVAYYFGALALGLLGGLSESSAWLTPTLMAAIVAALAIGDLPQLFGGYRLQVMTLDRAFVDESELIASLSVLLDAKVHEVRVRRVDLVDDTTVVEVRFQLGRAERSPRPLVPVLGQSDGPR
jgi:hypothetical protein